MPSNCTRSGNPANKRTEADALPYLKESLIVQYKMILKRGLIPIQHDPENMRSQGVSRPDATTHAERRDADRSTNPRVPQRQPGDRIRGAEPGRTVPVGAASAGGKGVRGARQEAAGSG